MATTRTASRRNPWLPEHVDRLRRMAASRPVGLIAYELGRTESSVRSKAHQEGISFDSPERSPYGKPASRGKTARRGKRAGGAGRATRARGAASGRRTTAGGRAGSGRRASTARRGGRARGKQR